MGGAFTNDDDDEEDDEGVSLIRIHSSSSSALGFSFLIGGCSSSLSSIMTESWEESVGGTFSETPKNTIIIIIIIIIIIVIVI